MCKADQVCQICPMTLRGTPSTPMIPMCTPNPFEILYEKQLDIEEGRTIFLSRHGESEYNVEDRIGGDSNLTPRGQLYARALGTYMNATGKILFVFHQTFWFLGSSEARPTILFDHVKNLGKSMEI